MKTSIMFAILGMLFLMVTFYFHEQAHVQIYKYDGIESRVEWFSHFPHAVTIAEERCKTESCRIGHNVNEVISYTLMPFYIMVFLGLLTIIKLMEYNTNG